MPHNHVQNCLRCGESPFRVQKTFVAVSFHNLAPNLQISTEYLKKAPVSSDRELTLSYKLLQDPKSNARHLRCNLLFGIVGHFALLEDVNISFFLSTIQNLQIISTFCGSEGGLYCRCRTCCFSAPYAIKHQHSLILYSNI